MFPPRGIECVRNVQLLHVVDTSTFMSLRCNAQKPHLNRKAIRIYVRCGRSCQCSASVAHLSFVPKVALNRMTHRKRNYYEFAANDLSDDDYYVENQESQISSPETASDRNASTSLPWLGEESQYFKNEEEDNDTAIEFTRSPIKRRASAVNAAKANNRLLSEGGYLDSQTTETQYFEACGVSGDADETLQTRSDTDVSRARSPLKEEGVAELSISSTPGRTKTTSPKPCPLLGHSARF
ncbi:hypothetical protein SCHPADRAFT_492131 [Schizopora paradoxa]|uniref:Uncharacterized protein n=1 Tax=Schizopora paradoxa TaxID=27342 RepID=A0A0H2RGP9_9AGAM|nr:hypothetical protein SCHPADRAFT_492131 [Schizopora paradoxa]